MMIDSRELLFRKMRITLNRLYPYFERMNHVHLPGGEVYYASELYDLLRELEDDRTIIQLNGTITINV